MFDRDPQAEFDAVVVANRRKDGDDEDLLVAIVEAKAGPDLYGDYRKATAA